MLATLNSLAVPAAFARHDKILDAAVLADLHAWKSSTESSLNQLDLLDLSTLSVSQLADLVRVLAPLSVVSQWSSSTMRSLASACLVRIPASDRLIAHILTQIVKPLFAPTPHPRLHASTARILPRPADVQDTYIEQPWKDHPGLDEVIRWCLLNIESSAYETIWPLFLPPVMSFLDDYQVPYKLLGVRLVSDMLARAPSSLLLRTGVDALIFSSLTNSLSHLGDQSTPDFIRLAVSATLQLVELTTPSAFPRRPCDNELGVPTRDLAQTLSPSQLKSLSTRFSRLSTLLSSSLLGTVIMYSPIFHPLAPSPTPDLEHADTSPIRASSFPATTPRRRSFNPTLVAAAHALPHVLCALGIGGARFLKGIIPVLMEWLALPLPVIDVETGTIHDDTGVASTRNVERSSYDGSKAFAVDVTLHLASLSSLSVLFRTCTSRMEGWSITIINAVGRCWVGCVDVENQRGNDILKDSLSTLKEQLKVIAIQLAEYPGVAQEYAILLAFNKQLFEGLIGGIKMNNASLVV